MLRYQSVHWLPPMGTRTVARQQARSAASAATTGGGAAGLQGCRSTPRRMLPQDRMESSQVSAAGRTATRSGWKAVRASAAWSALPLSPKSQALIRARKDAGSSTGA